MQQILSSLGPVTAVIGAQWGDEGKGKVTDILTEHYDVVARATGGANAGHTIVIDDHKHIFHLLPSGSFHEGKEIILGAGMVIHLPTLLEEIQTLRSHHIDVVPRLHISPAAHIVFDFHKAIDAAIEEMRGQSKGQKLGTTMRGIGPAYMDKAARIGIRIGAIDEDLRAELTEHGTLAKRMFGVDIDVDHELEHVAQAQETFGSCIGDNVSYLHELLRGGKTLLIEGAQGALLDIDHGTYPFVTSSATSVTAALHSLGLPHGTLTSCIGVAKAYCTRVGGGPFFTEATEEDANRLRERGAEYGATTGRPRRCGWLSLPDLRRALQINGFTHWNVTKIDVLDEEDKIPIGMGRDEGGSVVYEELPGWKQSTAGVKEFEKVPENAKKYIEFIEEHTGIPVALIGTGPGREAMVVRQV